MTDVLLSCHDLTVIHRASVHDRPAVSGLSFEVRQGESLSLIGVSGAGKSTLVRALVGLIPPNSGDVRWKGDVVFGGKVAPRPEIMGAFRRGLQVVFQDPVSSLNPKMSAEDIVLEGPLIHGTVTRGTRESTARTLLESVGLPADRTHDRAMQFSGGERQRLAIARALALNPSLLVLDEPTAALDSVAADSLANLLEELRETRGLALLLITHDIGLVKRIDGSVAVLDEGSIVETGDVSELLKAPTHPAAKRLVVAWDAVPPSG